MTSTRLLVLGVIRIAQPVHGYDVRRELISWRMEHYANVKGGSIYSALRTLEKDGLIAGTDTEGVPGRPERRQYVLTGEGDNEFLVMLREAWWRVETPNEPLIPAMSLMLSLPRDEVVAAVRSRIRRLEAQADQLRFFLAGIRDGATGADGQVPEHVRAIMSFAISRCRAEIDWSRGFQRDVQGGAYVFAGEPGAPDLGAGRGYAKLDGHSQS